MLPPTSVQSVSPFVRVKKVKKRGMGRAGAERIRLRV
jgi:hypothetical protein